MNSGAKQFKASHELLRILLLFCSISSLIMGILPSRSQNGSALLAIATAFQEGGMEKYNIEEIPSSLTTLVYSVQLQMFTSVSIT